VSAFNPLDSELQAACAKAATAEAVAQALFFVARSDYERAREAHRRAGFRAGERR
jgi:hypothetical protein